MELEISTKVQKVRIKAITILAIKRDDAVKLRTILTIEKNVNLDVVDELGFSPLMAAAAYNAAECLDCLLGTGNPNPRIHELFQMS